MSNARSHAVNPREGAPRGGFKPFRGHGAWTGAGPGTDARVPITDETHRFTALSVRLTGFDGAALEATGLTDTYRAVAAEQLGAGPYARLLHELREPDDSMDDDLREAARAVTYLWYTGSWPGRPPLTVSSRAYAEGLVWKAAGLKAPATDPEGYGSWAGTPDRSAPGDGTGGSGR
uniref:hypothetical protein n=1 Tax=Streptomyces sp. NBC_01001 TaxID=2903713 RepID=UPI002F908C4F